MTRSPATGQIHALTFFRFIAATVVVMTHFGPPTTLYQLSPPIFSAGAKMVTFFFVLSGFVLTLAAERRSNFNSTTYYRARFARIYPIYLLAVLLSVWLQPKGMDDGGVVIINLLMLQSWLPPYALMLNGPAWSLSVELFFYLLFPLVFIHGRRIASSRRIAFSAIGLHIITMFILNVLLNSSFYRGFPSKSHDFIFSFPVSHLATFLVGIAIAWIHLRHGDELRRRPGVLGAMLITGLVIVVVLMIEQENIKEITGLDFTFENGLSTLPFAAIVLATANLPSGIVRGFSHPIPILLGEASYGLYILHFPLHTAFDQYLGPHLQLGPNSNFAVYFAMTLIISVAVYRWIERPAKRLILGGPP